MGNWGAGPGNGFDIERTSLLFNGLFKIYLIGSISCDRIHLKFTYAFIFLKIRSH
jgi:hypothetical protein